MKNIIYGLYDPIELGGNLRYIGQSAQGINRAYEHKKPGKLHAKNHKVHWIKSLINQNTMYKAQILRDLGEFKDPKVRDAALNEAEIELIAYYKGLGVKLTNSTEGGEGTRGNILSDETKKQISLKRQEWLKNNELPKHLWETCYKKKVHEFINEIEHKHCKTCDTFKILGDFASNKSRWDGLSELCRICDAARQKIYKDSNKILLSEKDWQESYNLRTPKMANAIKRKYAEDPEYKKKISKATSKPIIAVLVLNPNTILEFESALAAKRSIHNFTNSSIGKSIKTGKPYRGYYWKFKV